MWFGVFDVCVRLLCLVSVLIRLDFLIFECLVKYILGWFVGGRLFMVMMFFRKLIGFVNSLCVVLVILGLGFGVMGKVIFML